MRKRGFIYKLIDIRDNSIFYIGKTYSIESRFKSHVSIYGNIIMKKVIECDVDMLDFYEKKLIKFYSNNNDLINIQHNTGSYEKFLYIIVNTIKNIVDKDGTCSRGYIKDNIIYQIYRSLRSKYDGINPIDKGKGYTIYSCECKLRSEGLKTISKILEDMGYEYVNYKNSITDKRCYFRKMDFWKYINVNE